MKAMKYIYALFLGLLMLGLGSCMEETEVNGGEQKVDGLRLSLSVSASDVISPLTKASATDAISGLDEIIMPDRFYPRYVGPVIETFVVVT